MVHRTIVMLSLVLVMVFAGVMPAAAQEENASVYVVHGIPGKDLGVDETLPVDISVNGECALPGFTFGEIAGPVALPAGTYDIAIRLANAEQPCANEPVLQAPISFEAGEQASVVAYLDTEGAPTAGKFSFDSEDLYSSRLRVVAHHTANAPTVDIRFIRQEKVDDRTSSRRLTEVSNGMYGSVDMRPGTWDISLRPSGTSHNDIGPITLPLEVNTIYLAYAVGSLENGTFTLLTKAIPQSE